MQLCPDSQLQLVQDCSNFKHKLKEDKLIKDDEANFEALKKCIKSINGAIHLEGFPEEMNEWSFFSFNNFRLQYKLRQLAYSQEEHAKLLIEHVKTTSELFGKLNELISQKRKFKSSN
uniref:Uncharacterized protein n=1 Tax=Strongyloides venezuelensis TaxID=75913 RepID=A0A0K0F4E0_STRVS